MIFTRRFGALAARPVFPSVQEREEWMDYFNEARPMETAPAHAQTDESAA